jgi:hypothetical protein
MGFAFVLGAAAAAVADVGFWFSFTPVSDADFPAVDAPSSRLFPSSKNLLRPSPGPLVAEPAVLEVEKVRLALFGLRTLIPVSRRWYVVSRFLPALAQSRPRVA